MGSALLDRRTVGGELPSSARSLWAGTWVLKDSRAFAPGQSRQPEAAGPVQSRPAPCGYSVFELSVSSPGLSFPARVGGARVRIHSA